MPAWCAEHHEFVNGWSRVTKTSYLVQWPGAFYSTVQVCFEKQPDLYPEAAITGNSSHNGTPALLATLPGSIVVCFPDLNRHDTVTYSVRIPAFNLLTNCTSVGLLTQPGRKGELTQKLLSCAGCCDAL